MDDLPAHKVAGVENAIRSAGASLLSLRPTRQLQPIEKFFFKLKSILRRLGVRTKEALDDAIADVCATYERRMQELLISCGYGVDSIGKRSSAHAQPPPDIVASLLPLDRKTFVALIKIAALTPPRVELLGRLFLAVRNGELVEPNRAGHELFRRRASVKLKLY